MGRVAQTPEEIVANLFRKIDQQGECTVCHLSPSMTRPGHYKQYVSVGGRTGTKWRVTRLVYFVVNGYFDPTLLVLHTCDNPLCINPEHLFLGTPQDNTDDMINKGRKVDDPTVGLRRKKQTGGAIKRLMDQGLNRHQISHRLCISLSTIWNYTNGPHKGFLCSE